MRALPTVPAGRRGVVCLSELLAAGWTREAVRHAVRAGRLERIAPGRFAPPPTDALDRFRRADLRLLRRAIAASLPGDRAAVSHLAGALHRRLPVWTDDPHPCVSTWSPTIRRAAGVHLHRLLDTTALVHRGGVAVTSAERTIVDIAREFGTEAALVPGDVALRTGLITLESLAAEVERSAGLPAVGAAARVGALLDPLSESPLESRSRWHFDSHGIPQPRSQVLLYTLDGTPLGRVDHYWDEGVVGEADGALKYRDPHDDRALEREKRRQQGFEDVDLEVARWAATDLRDFSAAAGRIQRCRERARHKDPGRRRWFAVATTVPRVPVHGVETP